jgi:hypothetical protein
MIRLQTLRIVLSVLSLAILGGAARGTDVWDELPSDALGAVVVRDLSHADVEVGQLLQALQIPLPRPLALVKAATGVDQGLNQQGDLLVAILPGRAGDDHLQLSVWLPLSDYDQLVRSLHGVPRERITAVTIAGEDVLVARHGDWAVVVDPDSRSRLEQVLDRPLSPTPQRAVPAAWSDWLKSNDVTAVVFQSGIGRVLSEVSRDEAAGEGTAGAVRPETLNWQADDDLFGSSGRNRGASAWQAARTAIHTALSEVPELSRRLLETSAIGCGLRLDADGNAVIGVRLVWPPDVAEGPAEVAAAAAPLPYDGGEFVVAGAGEVSRAWVVAATGPYARLLTKDLGIDAHKQAAAVEALHKSLVHAVEDVAGFAVLSRPGKTSEGIYTNSHLVVRVGSAKAFLDRAADVIARWNELADHARDEARLKFKSEPVQIAGHSGVQYSVDMVEVVGGGGLAVVRQSMERLFGPGGKLRLQVVPVGDRTVLVAAATEEQAAKVVELVAQDAPAPWNRDELRPTNQLMSADASWRIFISPHGYVRRQQRELDAIVGQVIGGPPVKDFPASPPLGVAGGGASDGIWFEIVAPAKTLEAFGQAAQ